MELLDPKDDFVFYWLFGRKLDYVKFKQLHEYHNYFDLYERDLKAKFINEFSLYEDDLKAKFIDELEIHFLELPKIELDIGKNKLLDWLIYFRYIITTGK